MPKGFIRLAESAVRDLEELRLWYVEQDAAAAGERTLRRMLDSIRLLEDLPDLGRIVPEFGQPPFAAGTDPAALSDRLSPRGAGRVDRADLA